MKQNIPENIFYILGILNSSAISFYGIRHSPIFSGAYYKFSAPYLRKLPIRRINYSNAIDNARYENMVSLVEQMLDLHKRKAETIDASDQERLRRLIVSSNQQIDALVYELYGLTPEEIAILAGAEKG